MSYSKGTLAGDFIDGVISDIPDVIAVCVVNLSSTLAMDTYCNTPDFDPDVASVYNVEMVKAGQKAMAVLKSKDTIKDILITLDTQLHLLTLSKTGNALYYVVADSRKANLSILRSTIRKYAKGIQ